MSFDSTGLLEARVRALVTIGCPRDAATLALHAHGPTVLRFLRARLASPDAADAAFVRFAGALWDGLASFRWRPSLRTWTFVLARAAARVPGAPCPLPRELEAMVRCVCSGARELATNARTSKVRALRQQLSDVEQTLLILRFGHALSWSDLAVVLEEVAADADASDLELAAMRMRARFRDAKHNLRTLAIRDGLLRRPT